MKYVQVQQKQVVGCVDGPRIGIREMSERQRRSVSAECGMWHEGYDNLPHPVSLYITYNHYSYIYNTLFNHSYYKFKFNSYNRSLLWQVYILKVNAQVWVSSSLKLEQKIEPKTENQGGLSLGLSVVVFYEVLYSKVYGI